MTTKGQVTIPIHVREHLGITPHDEVDFNLKDGAVIIEKRTQQKSANRFRELIGCRKTGRSTDEIMKDLRPYADDESDPGLQGAS